MQLTDYVFAVRNNLPMLVGQCDYNIAWLHYLRGEYSQAISLLCVARDSCPQNDDRYHFGSPPKFLDPVQAAWNIARMTEQVPAT